MYAREFNRCRLRNDVMIAALGSGKIDRERFVSLQNSNLLGPRPLGLTRPY